MLNMRLGYKLPFDFLGVQRQLSVKCVTIQTMIGLYFQPSIMCYFLFGNDFVDILALLGLASPIFSTASLSSLCFTLCFYTCSFSVFALVYHHHTLCFSLTFHTCVTTEHKHSLLSLLSHCLSSCSCRE
ncbi:hypothetical protein N665_0225s0023 [Sinapis alba]|nr:hypothetical protein N665_0225s0023 [Sinapis alba]